MAWILDEYSKFHGHSPAVVTGKPIVSGKEKLTRVKNSLLVLIPKKPLWFAEFCKKPLCLDNIMLTSRNFWSIYLSSGCLI